MIKSDKRLKELETVLNENNDEASVRAILFLREEESFEGAVALLSGLYDRTSNQLISKTIESFFNDIKDSSVRPEVMDEIKKNRRNETTRMLLSSCWQSGLDYSGWVVDLTEIFIESDYLLGLECMTIIENSIENISKATRIKMIKMIESGLKSYSGEKSSLALELVNILS
jgi:hypothetical protein